MTKLRGPVRAALLSAAATALLWACAPGTPPLEGTSGTGGDASATGSQAATGGSAAQGTGGQAAGTGGDGSGGKPDCVDPETDCLAPSGPCVAAICADTGSCAEESLPEGTPVKTQVIGDCKQLQCLANGNTQTVPDPADVLDDGKDCTQDTCSGTTPVSMALPLGTGCAQNGGTLCNGAGACVECLVDLDCSSGVCDQGACVPANCIDGTQNGGETDVDCGGPCNPCLDFEGCLVGADCQNLVCVGMICQPPTCSDAVKNAQETDIDCGGPTCAKCAPGKMCATSSDCTTLVCMGGLCSAASCADGVKNGGETNVDCGPPVSGCAGCANGTPCAQGIECAGGVCNAGSCCTPQAMATTCSGYCGVVVNNCGAPVDCGGCNQPQTCGGAGTPNVCGCGAGCPVFAKRFGDASDQALYSIAVDLANNVVIVGSFAGTIDFGGGALISAGGDDVFVAKFDPNGVLIWSKRFGSSSNQIARGVAFDTSGNTIVTGDFAGAIDFGGGSLLSQGGSDVFVAKLSATGAHVWSQRFGDGNSQVATSVAVDNTSAVVITGYFAGNIDFGGGAVLSQGGNDVFVAKLASNGAFGWSKGFGAAVDQFGDGVGVDSTGNVFLTGHFAGSIDFGGGLLVSAGVEDVFLAKLTNTGVYQWGKRFGDATAQIPRDIAVDSGGSAVITGSMAGNVDFGGGTIVSGGGTDAFLAKYNSLGNHLWSKRFGDAANQAGLDIALDTAGGVLFTGTLAGGADFGGGTLTSAGSDDVFVAKIDTNGNHMWSKRFGDASAQRGEAIAGDAFGAVYAGGAFAGTIDIGLGVLTSSGSNDAFFAKFGP